MIEDAEKSDQQHQHVDLDVHLSPTFRRGSRSADGAQHHVSKKHSNG